jgi:hypothetical protein
MKGLKFYLKDHDKVSARHPHKDLKEISFWSLSAVSIWSSIFCSKPYVILCRIQNNDWHHMESGVHFFRFEAVMLVSMRFLSSGICHHAKWYQVEVFQCFRGMCCLCLQGGEIILWNVSKLPPDFTASHSRRQQSSEFIFMECILLCVTITRESFFFFFIFLSPQQCFNRIFIPLCCYMFRSHKTIIRQKFMRLQNHTYLTGKDLYWCT